MFELSLEKQQKKTVRKNCNGKRFMTYILFSKAILIINTGHLKVHNTDIIDDLNEENNPKASRLTYF